MAGRRPRSAALADHRMEHVLAAEAGRLAVMLWPWPLWGMLLAAGWGLHRQWPGWHVAWMTAVVGVLLVFLFGHLTHHRKKATGRLLAPCTAAAAFTWLTLAQVHGATGTVFQVWLIFGAGACLGWSGWLHIHEHGDERGGKLFRDAAEDTSVSGLRAWVTEVLPGKTSGTMRVAPGDTPATVLKAHGELEASLSRKLPAGMAPGSLQLTEHPDQAHMLNWSLTDPRKLDKPTLWPGPSFPLVPGKPLASIAEPCRIGGFVDGADWKVPTHPRGLPGWQCLLMGMTGAGKTTGLGYSWLGEIITRRDVVVGAIDLSKGEQFLGVMRPALHALDLEYQPARARLWRLHKLRRQRSDWLATQGLQQWEEGCGLSAIVLWIEEASALFRQLGDTDVENWVLPLVLEARSAGIFIVLSLQRADFTQMPTTVRAQLGGICMGVRDAGDAGFGLSDDQSEHECHPERWKNEKPGMGYSDTPLLPGPEYKFVEARSYSWGRTTDLMRAHAAKYHTGCEGKEAPDQLTLAGFIEPPPPAAKPPAKPAQKPAQPPAGQVQQQPAPDEDEEAAMEPTEYDDPSLWQRNTADEAPIEPLAAADDEPTFGPPQHGNVSELPLSPEQATAKLRDVVTRWRDEGHDTITLDMVLALTSPTDDDGQPNPDYISRSRTWLYPAMAALVADPTLGLEQLDAPRRWAFIAAA